MGARSAYTARMLDILPRFLVQTEAGAPFLDWPCRLQKVPDGEGVRLSAKAEFDPSMPVSAYRLVFRFPLPEGAEPRVHHPALPRMIGVGSLPVAASLADGRRSPLTANYQFDERIGAQSYAVPPVCVLMDGESARFVVGVLSETRCRSSMAWSLVDGEIELEVQFDLWGLGRRAPKVSQLDTELLWIEALDHGWELGPHAFQGWHRQLDGLAKRPRQELFWGSWNDGHFRDIDQERILATSDWLREELPNVRWVQIDDGWAGPSPSVPGTLEPGGPSLDMSDFGVFYRPDDLEGDPRFPNGLGGLAQAIRDRGLRPMIWLTPSVMETSPLYRDHPEWFQDKVRLHFYREMRFLDFSVPEARAYAESVFQKVFREWGFQGCKLDYWSMGFDQHDVECRLGEQTSMEHMRWFAETLRRYVGPDGLLLYGIDLPFGSPLRSKPFDQFRYYADSEGSCQSMDAMREQALWAAFLVGLYQVQRYWVPDGDGLGLFSHFDMPARHFRLWSSFLLGSGTLTELAGWLHQAKSPRLEVLKRFVRHARLGDPVELPGYSFSQADADPPALWVRRAETGPNLVAATNWDAKPLLVSLNSELFGGAERVRDILTDEVLALPFEGEIPPEDGRAWVGA